MARRRRIGEFELIARYFAPLARGFKGAGGLITGLASGTHLTPSRCQITGLDKVADMRPTATIPAAWKPSSPAT